MSIFAEPVTIVHVKNGYHAVDANGKIVSGQRGSIAELELYLEKRRRQSASRRRPCMCCGTHFESEGAHNRLCNRCRSIDLSPMAP